MLKKCLNREDDDVKGVEVEEVVVVLVEGLEFFLVVCARKTNCMIWDPLAPSMAACHKPRHASVPAKRVEARAALVVRMTA